MLLRTLGWDRHRLVHFAKVIAVCTLAPLEILFPFLWCGFYIDILTHSRTHPKRFSNNWYFHKVILIRLLAASSWLLANDRFSQWGWLASGWFLVLRSWISCVTHDVVVCTHSLTELLSRVWNVRYVNFLSVRRLQCSHVVPFNDKKAFLNGRKRSTKEMKSGEKIIHLINDNRSYVSAATILSGRKIHLMDDCLELIFVYLSLSIYFK